VFDKSSMRMLLQNRLRRYRMVFPSFVVVVAFGRQLRMGPDIDKHHGVLRVSPRPPERVKTLFAQGLVSFVSIVPPWQAPGLPMNVLTIFTMRSVAQIKVSFRFHHLSPQE